MKKLLVAIVAVVLTAGFAFSVKAEDATVKTKVKTTAQGTVTTETAKIKTPEMKEKAKEVTKETAKGTVEETSVSKKMKEGDVKKETIKTDVETMGDKTVKETKIAIKPREGDVKTEKVTIRTFNENDPAKDTDNTVTVISGEKTVDMPIAKNWKQNHLQKFKNQTVTITSTYNPKLDAYVIKDIQLLDEAKANMKKK